MFSRKLSSIKQPLEFCIKTHEFLFFCVWGVNVFYYWLLVLNFDKKSAVLGSADFLVL